MSSLRGHDQMIILFWHSFYFRIVNYSLNFSILRKSSSCWRNVLRSSMPVLLCAQRIIDDRGLEKMIILRVLIQRIFSEAWIKCMLLSVSRRGREPCNSIILFAILKMPWSHYTLHLLPISVDDVGKVLLIIWIVV